MDLDKLINCHNQKLENIVGEDVHLSNRLGDRQGEKIKLKSRIMVSRLRKWIIGYTFILLILIFFNFKLISWLKTDKPPKTHVITMNENPFQPVFPGSISQALLEVAKWSE